MAAQDGEAAQALALLDQGLTAIPDDPDLLWAKAGLLEREGRIDEAIAIYDQLLSLIHIS